MKKEIVGRQVYYAGKFYKITDVIEPTRENNYYCNHYILVDGRELYEVRSTDCVFVKNKDVFHKITPIGTESAEIDKYLYENGIFVDSVLHGGFEEDDKLEIHICRGDWKHDHMCCDYLMSIIGWQKVEERIDEDTQEDNYSSMHYYKRNQN